MKKIITLLTALLLTAAIVLPVCARQGLLILESTTAQLGHTVFLKVSVTESLAGDTAGISYSFDEKQLEALPELCKWEKNSILQDFSTSDHAGVWGSSDVTDLYGTVCVLAFRVRPDAKIGDTKVTCSLKVKSGAKEVGTFQAEATVQIICGHTYGQWENNGSTFHKRTCSLCKDVQNQPHTWDDGTISSGNKADVDILTYRCTVCGGTKEQEIPKVSEGTTDTQPTQPSRPAQGNPPDPTLPTVTKPTNPPEESRPNQSGNSNDPSRPTESTRPNQSGNNSNQGNQNYPSGSQGNPGSNYGGNTHDHENGTPTPTVTPGQNPGSSDQNAGNPGGNTGTPGQITPAPQDPHAGHDHGSENTTTTVVGQNPFVAAGDIFLVLGILLAVGAVIVRKKFK